MVGITEITATAMTMAVTTKVTERISEIRMPIIVNTNKCIDKRIILRLV
jgi:hypothetical protein